MTDLPHGRGGTPLQNLIERGHDETKLTAFRMVPEMDAGPIYLQRTLSLHGSAEAIYVRATELSATMVGEILRKDPEPRPQQGEPVTFERRTPEQSEIENLDSLDDLHDFVRMLDAEGYPRAFIEHDGFRFEFSRSVRYDGRIEADVTITRTEREETER